MGSWPWQTYADYKINFQARIALSPSIRFGLGGALFLYLVQPLFSRAMERLGSRRLPVFAVLAAVMAADFVITVIF